MASTPDCSTRAYLTSDINRAPGGSRTHSSTLARWQASRYITGAFVVTSAKPPAGVEPARPSYQDGRLPLQHGGDFQCPRQESNLVHDLRRVVCDRHTPRTIHRAPGGGRTRDSGVGSRRVTTTPRVPSVGPGGFEPPPRRLRAESAAVTPRSHCGQFQVSEFQVSTRLRLKPWNLKPETRPVTRGGIEPPPPD